MKCLNCGAEIPEGAIFCPSCGTKAELPKTEPVADVCRQCQKPLNPGAQFCPNCGTSVSAQPVSSQPVSPFAPPRPGPAAPVRPQPQPQPQIYQQPYGYNPAPAYAPAAAPAKPRRKGKGLIVALVVILVLAIAGAGIFALLGGNINSIKRKVMGPKAAYLAIEGKALKQNTADLAADLVKYGNKDAKPLKGGYDIGLKFDFSEDALGIDAATAAILENITIDTRLVYDRTGDQPKYFNQLQLSATDEPLLSMDAFYDKEQMIIGFPDIIEQALVATSDEMSGLMGSTGVDPAEADASLSMLTSLMSADLGLDEAKLKASFSRIVDSMLDHIDKADFKASQPLAAGGVTARYDLYTITIKKESARQMLLEIFKDLRDDKEFYKLVSGFAGFSAMSSGMAVEDVLSFESYQTSIDSLIADLEADDSSEDFTIVQKIYVGKDEAVFGREVTIESESGSEQIHFLYAHPVSGNKEAVLCQFEAEEESFEFNSAYTVKDGKKTGAASISANGAEVIAASFSDLYTKTVGTSDRLLGSLELTFSEAAGVETTLPGLTAIRLTGSEDKSAYLMNVEIPDMIAMDISYSEIGASDVSFPSYDPNNLVSVSDTEALNALMTPDVQAKFMAIIQQLGLMPAES